MRKLKIFITVSLIFIHAWAAATLPQSSPAPGGVLQVQLPYSEQQTPEVTFQNHKVVVINHDQKWHALIGLPLDLKPGMQTALITNPIQTSISFKVHPKHYPEQKLKIKNKKMITPPEEEQKRINQEKGILHKIYTQWSSADPFKENYIPPLKGHITSIFGLKRFFNGIPTNPHAGLDVAAPMKTPIKAIHSGIIALNQNLFYTGNTVIIDHGKGVFSLYAHCSETSIEVGRHVSAGQVIGLVGQTGRVTGPHLHLGIIMNQTAVDPLLFIKREQIVPKKKPTEKQMKQSRKSARVNLV